MALADAYATEAQYRARLDRTDTSEDAELLEDLKAVSRWMDRYIGRHFNQDASALQRIYYPNSLSPDPSILWVDDIAVAPTEIIIDTDFDGSFADEIALASTDYDLWPINAAKGPEARPWNRIRLTPWGTKRYFTSATVRVTAQFGWPAVPEAIKQANIYLTQLLRAEGPRSTRRITEVEGTLEASTSAQSIIEKLIAVYRKPVF